MNISKLPSGTVVFEDVAKEWKRGKIKKTIKMASLKKQNEALVGRIVYETLNGWVLVSSIIVYIFMILVSYSIDEL